jgi:serine protease Do
MPSTGRDVLKLTAVIAVAFGLGLTFAHAFDLPRPGQAQAPVPASVAAPTAAPDRGRAAAGVLPSFSDVVERVNPAVVYIQTNSRSRSNPHGDLPPEMQDFFRRFQMPDQQPRIRQGSGSGFIVSRDGYILTNNHVVETADRVTVRLLDNREFPARVVGRDPNTDIAVIKIDAPDLPFVTFGNSDQVRVGDWVLAVGNPLGFTFTVTAGIVSAKGRTLDGLRSAEARYTIQDFIQTDAAINPGNSGGPLFDMDGHVVGVNSAIASQTGLYAGYGFAIPINLARRVMDDLIASGRVTRAVLGIRISEITPDAAAYVGLDRIAGVLVQDFPDRSSPALQAGVQPGDIIVALNDSAVGHVAQLQQMVGFRRPGDVVRVTVVRREGARTGVRRTLDVRLVQAEDDTAIASAEESGTRTKAAPMEGRLGLRIEAMPAEFVARGRLTEEQRGVLVSDVEEGGPAWQRVLSPNEGGPELILALNNQRVRTPEEFQRALRAVPRGEVVQLRVLNLQTGQTRIAFVRSRN